MAAHVLHVYQAMLRGAQPSADARQTIQLPECVCWHAVSRCRAGHRLISAGSMWMYSRRSAAWACAAAYQ